METMRKIETVGNKLKSNFCFTYLMISKNYSYLRASMGDNFDALRAGATPNTIPTAEETPKARITEVMVNFAGKTILIAKVPKNPRRIPTKPPRQDNITASIKN